MEFPFKRSRLLSLCGFVFLQGDSGGPLLYNGVAVGITSNGGKKCGQVRKPGIYTVISRYTQWIDDTLAGESVPTADPTAAET